MGSDDVHLIPSKIDSSGPSLEHHRTVPAPKIMLDLPFLSELALKHASLLESKVAEFEVRGHSFSHWPDVAMMGVVNLSKDSWYRESVAMNVDAAIRRGKRLVAEGARGVDRR